MEPTNEPPLTEAQTRALEAGMRRLRDARRRLLYIAPARDGSGLYGHLEGGGEVKLLRGELVWEIGEHRAARWFVLGLEEVPEAHHHQGDEPAGGQPDHG